MSDDPKPYTATPDELRAIDDALAEPTPEQIIAGAIERHAKGDPAALAQAILSALDAEGFEVRPKSDLMPIRRNSAGDM